MSDAEPESHLFGPKEAPRKMMNPMDAWEERTARVKRELEADRNASDAKTARLRALRLAKEAITADAGTFPHEPAKPPPLSARKRVGLSS